MYKDTWSAAAAIAKFTAYKNDLPGGIDIPVLLFKIQALSILLHSLKGIAPGDWRKCRQVTL